MRLLALLLVVGTSARAADGTLAVLDFASRLDNPREVDTRYFADVVRTAAVRTVPGVRVITRENLLVLLESTGKRIDECEGECEVDTGRRIGADYVISGDLLKVGTSYKLNLRLHETRGGQLLNGAVASGKTVDELDEHTNAAVQELLQPLRGVTVTRKVPPAAVQEAPAQPTGTVRKVGWGVVGASVLLGGVSGIYALKGRAATNAIMNGGQINGAQIQSRESDGLEANKYAYGFAAAAGVALITGVILVLKGAP